MNRAEELVSECSRLWAPPPDQKLSEWAEENFVLSPEYSAVTGRLVLYKFQREILDSFTDPYVTETDVMSATQMIKTLAQMVAIAYIIHRAPGPILAAQPTETDGETFSKERIAPMIRDNPYLRERITEPRRGKADNTTLHKMFPGGSLSVIGAQTPGNFARRSIRYFFGDERDIWPKVVGKAGDGWSLGVKRQSTFRSRAKRMQTCSPTIEGDSAISDAYAASDQRKFHVPCPKCGVSQILRWAQVKDPRLPGDQPPLTAYQCEHCGALWTDVERWDACEKGEWIADAPFRGIAGFWISEIYSPWKKLSDLVDDFLSKKDDPVKLQTFVNTSLAETWKEKGEAPDHEKLMSRREESYRLGQVPAGVLFLTAGVDVQKTWLEGYIYGWGRGRQRWVVDHFRIEGSPFTPEVWEQLTEELNTQHRHPSGVFLSIVRMAVDTGHATNEVYCWVKQQGAGRVLAVDGRSSGSALVGAPSPVDVTVGGRKIRHGIKIWPVNVSMAKSELYGLLGKERPADGDPYPAGWVHFAKDLDEEFFKQLTAEQLTTHVNKAGYRKTEWIKIRERNEALDCANYARAAASVVGMDRFGEHNWKEMEAALRIESAPAQTVAESMVAPKVEADLGEVTKPALIRRFYPRSRVVGRFRG